VSTPSDILQAKCVLRERIKVWRAGLSTQAKLQAANALADQALPFLQPMLWDGCIVSGFASLPEELRVWPLLSRLHAAGIALALPVMQGKGKPLIFRAWSPGDLTDQRVWGIAEPKPDKPVVEPDILLVPLLAFDAHGNRLGYGGGYYDRTLRALRAAKPIVAVGLAYDQQQVDAVPHLDYDQRLDWVLRPSGPIRCLDS
jgi:5-formyltetrahydrofolate cyclo-ligase